jgi:DNA-binding transcriptional regulator YhcF (GntR family)
MNESEVSGAVADEQRGTLLGPPPARETISTAVYRQLREAILTARLPMGTRINEVELASDWRISRTPIRDALRRLEAEGLVQSAPGRGMIVPVLARADVDELYTMREGLEGMAARLAAERATPQFLAPPGYLSVDQLKMRAAMADKLHGTFDFKTISNAFFVAVGTAEKVANQIGEWCTRMKTNHINCVTHVADMPHWKTVKNLTLMAEEVFPRLRSREHSAHRMAAE